MAETPTTPTESATQTTDSAASTTESAAADTTTPAATEQTDPATTTESTEAAEYADFVVPEGITLDPELTTEFKAMAKDIGLKQDQAQQFTDLAVKLSQKFVDHQQQVVTEQRTAWESAARVDKEIGGDKFNENLAVAKKAVEALATPELMALLDSSGLGSHPDMIRMFFKTGQMLSEDGVVTGTRRASTPEKTPAQRLYPNHS